MADASVKMGVTGISQFKQGMNQAQQSVKTLDAALKLNEKQLQATGDKETYMQQKSKLLQQQIAAQNTVIKQGQQALAAMEKNGVNPASQAYQKMQQQVLNAQTALLGMHGDLDSVGESAQETAQKTDKLADSLNGINKKVSFDAVINGIGKITDGMEAAARKVAALARDVWDTMAMAASWADSENTLAAMYGIDVETLQKMQGASRTIDTSVEAIIKSRQKLKQNMASDSKEIAAAFTHLGVSVGYMAGKQGEIRVFRNWEDVFWDVGAALLNYNDEVERDVIAQNLFGRSWMELMPLFQAGRKEYEDTLAKQNVVSEDSVKKLNDLDDALQRLDQDYQATKQTLLATVAPAFTTVGNTVADVMEKVNAYLQTPEGQEKLEALGKAAEELFDDLTDSEAIDAAGVVGGALDSVKEALLWIKDNKDTVVSAIKAIGGAFLALKAAEIVGSLAQGAAALKNLIGSGAGAAGAAGASGTGAAAAGLAAAVPVTGSIPGWLRGLGIAELFHIADQNTRNDPLTLWGRLHGATGPQILGTVEPYIPAPTLPTSTQLRRSKGGTLATASEESMQGRIIERTTEMIYDDLYKAINDYDPDTNALNTTQFFDNILYPLVKEAGKQSGVGGDSIDSIADLIYDKWIQSLYDEEWEGSTGGILNILQEAIDEAAAEGLSVKTTPDLVDNAAQVLQEQMSGVTLHVSVVPDMAAIPDGSHANGLPFVPFDGYIAALHKGERVVPASQNKNYSATSNLYVESMYMNNGTDAQGLAAAIAEENRRIRSGFGS